MCYNQSPSQIWVKYNYSFAKDSLQKEIKSADVMVLEIDSEKSQFFSLLKYEGEMKLKQDVANGVDSFTMMANKNKYASNKSNLVVFKHRENHTIAYFDKILTEPYQYVEEKINFRWKVLPEFGKINNIKVQKAMGSYAGRNYEAWFSVEEYPFSEGPYKFYGLPGLILKITDTGNNFLFEAVEIQALKKMTVLETLRFTPITRGKFLEMKKSSVQDFLNFINSQTEVSIKPVSTNGNAQKQKPYNPIELN